MELKTVGFFQCTLHEVSADTYPTKKQNLLKSSWDLTNAIHTITLFLLKMMQLFGCTNNDNMSMYRVLDVMYVNVEMVVLFCMKSNLTTHAQNPGMNLMDNLQ